MKVCLVNRYFDFRGTGVTRIATEVSRELERRGHDVVKVATSGNSLYSYAWHTGARIAFTLPRKGIDVYHALATMEAMWLPKHKSIATYLDLFTTTNPDRAGAGMGYSKWKLEVGRRYFALGSQVAARCRFLVCISEKTKQDVLKHIEVDESKLRVIRLGISETLQPEHRKHGRLVIGTLSQLDKRKRVHLLIKAFRRSRLDATLLIAGEGPDRLMLEAIAGDDSRIRFLGLVPDHKLNDFYNALSLFVFPTGIEGLGLPAIEAMACGKPVVVLDDAILPRDIRDRSVSIEDLKLLFSNHNRMETIMELGGPMYESNLEFAREHRWSKCVAQYIELYEQIKEDN
jgi:glycosyltransferase involved in cell wall biosynthesis